MKFNSYTLLLLASVVVASFSQILLKTSARIEHGSLLKEYVNRYALSGYFLLGVSTILTVLAFRGMEYKNGPVLESLGFILVPLLSFLFLREKLTKRGLFGYLLIVAGVVVFYS